MRLKIEVHLEGVCDVAVNNSPSFAIATPVRKFSCFGEEPYMMAFTNNNDSDSWIDFQSLTCR